jgi:hypothetical protein
MAAISRTSRFPETEQNARIYRQLHFKRWMLARSGHAPSVRHKRESIVDDSGHERLPDLRHDLRIHEFALLVHAPDWSFTAERQWFEAIIGPPRGSSERRRLHRA